MKKKVSVDDFWQEFEPIWQQHQLESGARHRIRDRFAKESPARQRSGDTAKNAEIEPPAPSVTHRPRAAAAYEIDLLDARIEQGRDNVALQEVDECHAVIGNDEDAFFCHMV